MIDNPPAMPAAAVAETASTHEGSFTWHEIDAPDGRRRFKLYVPSGYDKNKAIPLLVVLHGCTQDPDNIARGTRFNELAEAQTFLVAYPEQPQKANGLKCWNWFDQTHQMRDAGEPALIAGITRCVITDYNADKRRIFVAGVSAGGAMALIVAYAYPDIFAAAGIHSGIAYGAATNMGNAVKAMGAGAADSLSLSESVTRAMGSARHFPAIVFQGDGDKSVRAVNAAQIVSQLSGLFKPEKLTKLSETPGTSAGGYHFTRRIYGATAHGQAMIEEWMVTELGHAWSGGSANGTYTDPKGPDASREMIRFFLEHPKH